MKYKNRLRKDPIILIGYCFLLFSFVSRALYSHLIIEMFPGKHIPGFRWITPFICFFLIPFLSNKTTGKHIFAAIFLLDAIFCISDCLSTFINYFSDNAWITIICTCMHIMFDSIITLGIYKLHIQRRIIWGTLLAVFCIDTAFLTSPSSLIWYAFLSSVTYTLALAFLVPRFLKLFKPLSYFQKKVYGEVSLRELKKQYDSGQITEQCYFSLKSEILDNL